MKRVILQDIAKALGLSQSAVSQALRGLPSIPDQTRKKVRDMADQMGYQPDPFLSALASRRHTGHAVQYRAQLAYVTAMEAKFLQSWCHLDAYKGVYLRASELGYQIESHNLDPKSSVDHRRLARSLAARGVKGLIVSSAPQTMVEIDFPWNQFTAIGFGSEPFIDKCHTFVSAHGHLMKLLLTRLKALGYRRLVFFTQRGSRISPILEDLLGFYRLWSPRFEFTSEYRGQVTENHKELILGYFERHRPDVVIWAGASDWYLRMFRQWGWRFPEDLGWCDIDVRAIGESISGTVQNRIPMGQAAVSFLHALITSSQTGLSSIPCSFQIQSRWNEGKTLSDHA